MPDLPEAKRGSKSRLPQGEVRAMEIPIRSTPAIDEPQGEVRASAYEPFITGRPSGLSIFIDYLPRDEKLREVHTGLNL